MVESVNAEIHNILEKRIRELSESHYSARVKSVGKHNGTHQFCTDYCQLSAITEFQCATLPDANSLFARTVVKISIFHTY